MLNTSFEMCGAKWRFLTSLNMYGLSTDCLSRKVSSFTLPLPHSETVEVTETGLSVGLK